MLRKLLIAACALFAFSGLYLLTAAEPSGGAQRSVAEKLFKEGNWRDAHAIYSKLALDENASGASLASDFENGVTCLRNLQQQQQEDTFREAVIAAHPQDWQLLSKGADTLQNGVHYGFIVAGKFQRGNQRGGGAWAMSMEWDRVRALQLMQQAMGAIEKGDASASEKGQFYSRFAGLILSNRSGSEAWQLQDLTDLSQLPEIEANEGYGWRGRGGWGGGGGSKGAPVDAEGNPVYHTIPANWEAATTDGQRWRFCLEQMARHDTSLRDSADWTFAQFQMQQFGVQSMRQWGITLPSGSSENVDGDKDESGPYALSTLKETETIARLANGVKRFSIPDEYNHIAILKQLGARNGSFSDNALQTLASIFENRQQYVRAAEYWRESIQRFKDPNKNKDNRLQQIVGNWGTIENGSTQAAQGGASLDYRFRNGKQVTLTAHKLKVSELVNDVKAYIKSAPKQLDWNRLQLDNIGYLVVNQNQAKYVGEKVAEWKVDLTPRDAHYDRRLTIAVPLQQAGAYLVEAKMANGNATRVVMWIADTAIAKKQLNGKVLYYVADAVSGKPIEKANVEFFGWKNEHIPNTKNEYRIVTANFAEFSDADGMVLPDTKQLDQQMQWVVVARTGKEGEPGARFAHLGFNGIWYGNRQEQTFDQSKVIVLTDRPVYRPDQKVQFKFWVREARYDGKEGSQFANKTFTLKINDPMGTEVFKQQVTTDEFGGFAGEYPLLVDAKLGVYQIYIEHAHGVGGGSSFRVEEYKKPEFQVLIDAPTDPVKLGDKVTATIRAKYYFGAPVSKGTVKFKVVRSAHEARWYPAMPWDWMYGEGYWWFSPDYSWYRGYGKWGCMAPRPFWHHWNPEPPELVLDQEVEIGEDGTVQVEIDTALARALHGDQDHSYSITAEVVDASRRTIVGSGSVLVARQPFKVFSWTDRGHYRVGDTIVANFQARTLDGKGVEGAGQLRLLRITYNEKGEPVENVAQEWVLPTNGEGYAKQELKASEPGQYRLSYNVTSGEGDKAKTIEGGYLFVVRGDGFDGSEFQFNDLELITDKTSYKPGEKVELLINTNRVGSTVLLFLRPSHGVYEGKPQVLRLTGKSTTVDVGVVQKDMPNFFIEAVTIAGAKVHTIVREVIVPPEERILNLELTSDSESYLPGAKAKVQV
ncbi:MAG: MG2 domain-containing protein, partial [Planctomycetaceae bacterium]